MIKRENIDKNLTTFAQLDEPVIGYVESNGFENQLRPRFLQDYVGQSEIKKNLLVAIEAAKRRDEQLDHILLHGFPGLGKTTLAAVTAQEMGVNLKITSGPALDKAGDVAAILSNLEDKDILFIDEIHRLKPTVEEVLYTAMEDFGIDLVIGKGPAARSMRISLPKFTLIGATTKVNMLSAPLLSRFGSTFKLSFYTDQEIIDILKKSAQILGMEIDESVALKLAKSARQTPRIANRLLKRVRDLAEVRNHKRIERDVLDEALSLLGIDEGGLDKVDREILSAIVEQFKGGPVGLSTLAAAVSEEKDTIEEIYEPFLIKAGFLERTARGRIATEKAHQHLNLKFHEKR